MWLDGFFFLSVSCGNHQILFLNLVLFGNGIHPFEGDGGNGVSAFVCYSCGLFKFPNHTNFLKYLTETLGEHLFVQLQR